MKRRNFLKAAAFAGLAVVTPWSLNSRRAKAAEGYDGLFFINVSAGGGWDPTSFCDPKGRANEEAVDPINMYMTGDIGTAGAINYAPVAGNQAFFDKYHSQLLVINGVDTETNNHDAGTRTVFSGKLGEGHPSFGALVAAELAPEKPMAFISNGGYDYTAERVALTRIGSNVDTFRRVAFPNRADPNNENDLYHALGGFERIQAYQKERIQALQQRQGLPRIQKSMNALFTSRAADNELARLNEHLPQPLTDSNNPIVRQAEVALAAYKAGLAVSANFSLGGFDTHGNHDDNHYPRLQTLFEGVDFIMQEAERQGVADKVVVYMGSDFGRTPWYNDGNGKDHWSITSVMLMGAGIKGGRVIGATDAEFKARTVNPSTLALDDSGIRINSSHIHKALRKLAGIEGGEVEKYYPLGGVEDLNLFG